MFRAGNQPGLDCRLPKGNEQIPNDLEIRFCSVEWGLEWACLAGLRLGPAYSFSLESSKGDAHWRGEKKGETSEQAFQQGLEPRKHFPRCLKIVQAMLANNLQRSYVSFLSLKIQMWNIHPHRPPLLLNTKKVANML